MVKRICDRCGKEISRPKKPKRIRYALHYLHFGILMGETEDAPRVEHDLCPECAQVLLDWIENPKEEKP